MMALYSSEGQLHRLIPTDAGLIELGCHRKFGFLSPKMLSSRHRISSAKKFGKVSSLDNAWVFQFTISGENPVYSKDCILEHKKPGLWHVHSRIGTFILSTWDQAHLNLPLSSDIEISSHQRWLWGVPLLSLFFFALLLQLKTPLKPVEEEKKPVAMVYVSPEVLQPKIVSSPEVKDVAKSARKSKSKNTANAFDVLKSSQAIGGALSLPKNSSQGSGGSRGNGDLFRTVGASTKSLNIGQGGISGLGGQGDSGVLGSGTGLGKAYIRGGASGGGKVLAGMGGGSGEELDGGLGEDVIAATIARYLNQVRTCYEKFLANTPGLAGQILVDFEINSSGKVNFAKIRQSSLARNEVGDCVSTRMLTWQFPRPQGGALVKVSHPFTFKPSNYM